jgi:hypothetical protein
MDRCIVSRPHGCLFRKQDSRKDVQESSLVNEKSMTVSLRKIVFEEEIRDPVLDAADGLS